MEFSYWNSNWADSIITQHLGTRQDPAELHER
jgi:hypothetical protein